MQEVGRAQHLTLVLTLVLIASNGLIMILPDNIDLRLLLGRRRLLLYLLAILIPPLNHPMNSPVKDLKRLYIRLHHLVDCEDLVRWLLLPLCVGYGLGEILAVPM